MVAVLAGDGTARLLRSGIAAPTRIIGSKITKIIISPRRARPCQTYLIAFRPFLSRFIRCPPPRFRKIYAGVGAKVAPETGKIVSGGARDPQNGVKNGKNPPIRGALRTAA